MNKPQAGEENDLVSANLSKSAEKTTFQPNTKTLHKKNCTGETVLHLACKRQDLTQVKALINAGLDVNSPDFAGWTALHEGAVTGNWAVVEALLKAGAHVNARSMNGDTPLHDAVLSGNYEVVKLLLEHSANPHDKNVGGLCALDMAESSDIRELLHTFHHSAAEKTPSGSSCLKPQSSKVRSRASSDTENVRQSHTSTQSQSSSKALALVLSEVQVKLSKLEGCSPTELVDAGKCCATLWDIHTTLTQVLAKQHMEKEYLAHMYWSVPDCLRKHILKSRLISLASAQSKLVDVLQKQMKVVDEYLTLKSELFTETCNNEQAQSTNCPALAAAPPKESVCRPMVHIASQTSTVVTPPSPTQVNMALTPTQEVCTQETTCQNCTTQLQSTFQKNTSRAATGAFAITNHTTTVPSTTRSNQSIGVVQKETEDKHLLRFLHRGVMSPGAPLLFFFKGTIHFAKVQSNGLLKDSKGRVHLTVEDWLKHIVGKNIPISSAYAWDKVTFGGRPLSHHWTNVEQIPCVEKELCNSSFLDMVTAVADGLTLVMKIKVVRVVGNDEMVPNALMDQYWEQLLKEDSWTF